MEQDNNLWKDKLKPLLLCLREAATEGQQFDPRQRDYDPKASHDAMIYEAGRISVINEILGFVDPD